MSNLEAHARELEADSRALQNKLGEVITSYFSEDREGIDDQTLELVGVLEVAYWDVVSALCGVMRVIESLAPSPVE